MEVWKDVVGYEGHYKVSNMGKVLSLKTGVVMKQNTNRKGYLRCGLCKDGKQSQHFVHRLVAKSFIPNPNNLPMVNHKDENKQNNCVDNLEWCTNSYNTHYGTAIERKAKNSCKKVDQYMKDGTFVKTWDGIVLASMSLGISASHITECCQGKLKKTGGYKWEYAERGD